MLNDRDGGTFKKPKLVKRKCRKHKTLNNWKINYSYRKIKYYKTGETTSGQTNNKQDLLRQKTFPINKQGVRKKKRVEAMLRNGK